MHQQTPSLSQVHIWYYIYKAVSVTSFAAAVEVCWLDFCALYFVTVYDLIPLWILSVYVRVKTSTAKNNSN